MPFYASVDQVMRDRSELARKGISRGRSVVVLAYAGGVLFVAENRSTALHKVSEIYDRIGFAAVGRYNEFENLRVAGIRHADLRGYSYDRRDVTGRALANAYAQTLGAIFTEQQKPYEVELCVAEVGDVAERDQLYRITYDGSISDEPRFVVMGGLTEPISAALRESYAEGLALQQAVDVAVRALDTPSGSTPPLPSADGGTATDNRRLGVGALEVAVLDRNRPRRAFRRIVGGALSALLPAEPAARGAEPGAVEDPPAGPGAEEGGA